MSEPTYRQTLRHAWQMTWHNKSLWGLGLLSALFAGSFGINNFLGQLVTSVAHQGEIIIFSLPNFNFLPGQFATGYYGTAIMGLVMAAIFIAVIYISVVAKTALITAMADYYKKDREPRLNKLWDKSLDHFWKIFALETGRKITYFFILFLFGLFLTNANFATSGYGVVLSSLLLVIAIILALIVSSVTIFASGYVVIDRQSLVNGLANGFKLFRRHLLVCLEASIVLLFIDFLLVALIAGVISIFFLPVTALSFIAALLASPALLAWGLIFTVVLLVAAIILIGAIYNTFYTGAWIYLFMEMHHAGILSRIRGFIKHLFK